jgi:hypothetical protein
MPEGIPYASSNVTAGVGLELNYLGRHCFAYSGWVPVGSSNVNLLEFTTGNNYIIAEFQFSSAAAHTDNFQYQVKLNDTGTFSYIVTDAAQYTDPDLPIRIVIPPYTNVKAMAKNLSSGTEYGQNVVMTGKLYK